MSQTDTYRPKARPAWLCTQPEFLLGFWVKQLETDFEEVFLVVTTSWDKKGECFHESLRVGSHLASLDRVLIGACMLEIAWGCSNIAERGLTLRSIFLFFCGAEVQVLYH